MIWKVPILIKRKISIKIKSPEADMFKFAPFLHTPFPFCPSCLTALTEFDPLEARGHNPLPFYPFSN